MVKMVSVLIFTRLGLTYVLNFTRLEIYHNLHLAFPFKCIFILLILRKNKSAMTLISQKSIKITHPIKYLRATTFYT